MGKFKVGHIYVYIYPNGRMSPCIYKVSSVWDEPDAIEFEWFHVLREESGVKTYSKSDLKRFKPAPRLVKVLYGI